MFAYTNSFTTKLSYLRCHNCQLSLLRYLQKKPRFIPKSASKIFYVRKPTPKDPEETEELKIRYRHYRTHLKSLHSFMKTWQENVDYIEEDVEHIAELEAEEQRRRMAINNEWNQQVALIREARLNEEAKLENERLSAHEMAKDMQGLIQQEEAKKRVIEEMNSSFIRAEDLDEEINKVMSTLKNYNFSIDTKGNKLYTEDRT